MTIFFDLKRKASALAVKGFASCLLIFVLAPSLSMASTNYAGMSDYEILGVDASADQNAITRAWRAKVSKLHPDRAVSMGLSAQQAKDNEAALQIVNAAYNRIKNGEAEMNNRYYDDSESRSSSSTQSRQYYQSDREELLNEKDFYRSGREGAYEKYSAESFINWMDSVGQRRNYKIDAEWIGFVNKFATLYLHHFERGTRASELSILEWAATGLMNKYFTPRTTDGSTTWYDNGRIQFFMKSIILAMGNVPTMGQTLLRVVKNPGQQGMPSLKYSFYEDVSAVEYLQDIAVHFSGGYANPSTRQVFYPDISKESAIAFDHAIRMEAQYQTESRSAGKATNWFKNIWRRKSARSCDHVFNE